MAVATHVSRVAKDYAPFGYSIMEDVCVRNPGILTATGNHYITIYTPQDADAYIESACIIFDADTSANAKWDLTINNEALESGALNSDPLNTQSLTKYTVYDLGLDQNQIVAQNQVISARFDDDSSSANLADFSIQLRIRRKA